MTYNEFINDILSTRGRFNCNGYKERHHIIPRCLGGSDDDDNLIDLYAREHVIAHKLLAQENPDHRGLVLAYTKMVWCSSPNFGESRPYTPEEYEEARVAFANSQKGANNPIHGHEMVGVNNGMFGRRHSEESLRLLREHTRDVSGEKNPMYGKGVRSRKVKCVETGKTWDSAKAAAIEMETSPTNIQRVCRGKQKTACGYHWIYISPPCDRSVMCVETGEIFPSINNVAKTKGYSSSCIRGCIEGKQKTAYGYHWEEVLYDKF